MTSKIMAEELEYRLAVETDVDVIANFLFTYFYKEEPCTQAMKIPLEEVVDLYREIVVRCLKFPFSTIVQTGTGEIVGVLLVSVWNRHDSLEDNDYDGAKSSEEINAFIKLLNDIHSDFWCRAPSDVEAVLHREISSVAPHFQRKGIATRLLTQNMSPEKLKTYKIGGVISETSSFCNQCLLKKNGFRPLKEIAYSSVVDSKGQPILKTSDGSQSIILNYKSIADF